MVISLLIILAIVLGSKVVYKDSFAIVSGKLSNGEATINYPEGFNKDNCVIISFSLDNANLDTDVRHWAYGNLFDSSSWVGGSIPYKIGMYSSNIKIETKRVIILNEEYPSVGESTVKHNYKLVLMKIGD